MQMKAGDIVTGIITGIQPYGAFVALDDGHKGLIHISEVSERFVKDVHMYLHMNERVTVKVLEVDQEEDHMKLSLKAVVSNKQRFRSMKRSSVQALPNSVIGFSSLKEMLDGWIEEAYNR